MKALIIFAILSCLISPAQPLTCKCQKPAPEKPTMGNMFEARGLGQMRQIRGTVYYWSPKRAKNAIVEVFDSNLDSMAKHLPYDEVLKVTSREARASCMTGPDGRFCFPELPPGNYLLRIGTRGERQYSGWHFPVTVDPEAASEPGEGLKVSFMMSL